MTLDTIILPTEVVLSRNVPGSVRTKCIDISAGKLRISGLLLSITKFSV
jgi:hypothetical protein